MLINRDNQSWADANLFRVFAHLTRRHFSDAMGKDATLLGKTRTQKTRRVTDVKFRVF